MTIIIYPNPTPLGRQDCPLESRGHGHARGRNAQQRLGEIDQLPALFFLESLSILLAGKGNKIRDHVRYDLAADHVNSLTCRYKPLSVPVSHHDCGEGVRPPFIVDQPHQTGNATRGQLPAVFIFNSGCRVLKRIDIHTAYLAAFPLNSITCPNANRNKKYQD
jgi:hypothetical protein